jgi:hypothetical protein
MHAFLLPLVLALGVQQHVHQPGMNHQEELKRRGALAMGFDQDTTVHRFRSTATGGSIEVEVKDTADAVSLAAIRSHLEEIARAFANGDFAKPFQTHAEVPPGVPAMQRLRGAIRYRYEETPRGGLVRITTTNPKALAAVHEFLAYQAREHQAG